MTSSVTASVPSHGRQIAAPTHTYEAQHAPPSPSLQRLHRNLQKNPCGDFAEDSFRVSGNSKESSATRAANLCSRSPDRMEPRRGSGGKIISFFPRRLSAAFDARKRPPARCTLQQQRNAALPQQQILLPETFPEISYPPSTLHKIWKQFVQTSYIIRGIFCTSSHCNSCLNMVYYPRTRKV